MSKISTKTKRSILVLTFFAIAITVGSAFTIVWMQQQITRTAQRSNNLEKQLAEKTRKLRYLDERIAEQHQPLVLQGKVTGLLRPSTENQVVWVREMNSTGGRAYAAEQPYQKSMDIAFVEMNSVLQR